MVRITGHGALEILLSSLRQLTCSNILPLPKMTEFWKCYYISSHLLIEGRIIITEISDYLALATSITFESTSAAWRFPKTSNYSTLSDSVASVLITTLSFVKAFILLSPCSPLNVAVIPITLYLFKRMIAESSLVPIIVGVSAKKSESISSTRSIALKGMLPVRRSL